MTSVDPYNYWLRFGGTPYLENTKRINFEYQERKVFSYLRTKLKRKEIRSILEIGCGCGRFTNILARSFPDAGEIITIDFSPQQISCALSLNHNNARDNRIKFYVSGILDDLKFMEIDKKFDLVFAAEVFLHILHCDIQRVLIRCCELSSNHVIHIDPIFNNEHKELIYYSRDRIVTDFIFFHDYLNIIKSINQDIKIRYTRLKLLKQAIYHYKVNG